MTWVNVEDDGPREILPPAALKAVGVLLATVVVLALVARITGMGAVLNPGEDARDAVAERWLVFEMEGGLEDRMVVRNAETGDVLSELLPGEGGFLRGAIRPLNRERTRVDQDPAEAYRLVLWSDGALVLVDPLTDLVVDLHAFGPTNAGAFAALLPRVERGAAATSPPPHAGGIAP
ncbi:MAG: photosynthetic complex assembly protein PuhC [Gemmatimonadales bacterium]|nr:MAG: photosynthetic complex assembly protein PuhC [Gemmatimonadales bacterium]